MHKNILIGVYSLGNASSILSSFKDNNSSKMPAVSSFSLVSFNIIVYYRYTIS